MKTKNYNPFKMWGSYVGAILYLLIFGLYPLINIERDLDFISKIVFEIPIFLLDLVPIGFAMNHPAIYEFLGKTSIALTVFLIEIDIIILGLAGFLIGWGIHSLFRRFSNK